MNLNSLSSKDNPIGFFEYFFKEGYSIFYRNFFGIEHSNAPLYAPKKSLRAKSEKSEAGIWTITKDELSGGSNGGFVLFESELNKLLKEQINNSLEIIKSQVLNHINKEQLPHYLTTLASRLQVLLETNKDSEIISKHPIIILNFQYLFNNIYTQSNNSTSIPDKLRSFHELINSDKGKSGNTFKMKPQYLERIEKLYEALLNGGLIDSRTSIEEFKQAFSGGYFSQSSKILWTGEGKNKLFSKASILYFIKALENNDIIEATKDEKDFKILITACFLDNLGNSLPNFGESFSALKKKSSSSNQKKMDALISSVFF